MKLFFAILFWLTLLELAWAHDIYHFVQGTACRCGEERLCEAVEAIPLGSNKYYLPASGETVSAHAVVSSPDDRFHRCTYPLNMQWHPRYGVPAYPGAQYEQGGKMLETEGPEGWIALPNNSTRDGKPKTRCFFAPRVTS